MRCSLECHKGCECQPGMKYLVEGDEPITLESFLDYINDDAFFEEYDDTPDAEVDVAEILRRMREAR